ncbi:MAG: hypothetical protein KAI24_14950 [Planctomycetes bacterium]|nr:hypothetical protein [Planctomycetota bacterium]
MDERQLLAQILADPDDDAPRRELAACWSRRGDPRGAFVTAQLQLAALPRWHPDRPALEARADALLAEHREPWLREVPHGELAVRFERGFVARAEGTPAQVCAHLPALAAAAPVTALELAAEEQEDGPKDAAVAALRGCAGLAGLRELTLYDGELHADSWAELLGAPVWGALQAVELGEAMCTAEHAAATAATALPANVRALRFEGHMGGMGDAGVAALLQAPWLPQLDLLTLNGQSLGDASLAAIAASALRPSTLGIGGAGYGEHTFTADALRAAARTPPFAGLASLSLVGAPVGEALPELLVSCRALRSASLARTGADGDDVRAAARAVSFAGWRQLDLGGNPIGDLGARALAAGRELPRVLGLAGCGITPDGLRELGAAPPVDALDLRGNALPADAWQRLLDEDRLPAARALLADANDWSPELAAAIRGRYPRADLVGAPA